MHEVVKEAVAYARKNGPVLIEAVTYRYKGHGVTDRSYMKREEELREWMENQDPIHILHREIVEQFPDANGELSRLSEKAFGVVDEAVNFALNSEPPGQEDLMSNVYVE